MFTGLIHHCGTITQIHSTTTGKRLQITCQFQDLITGESIAVDGACLTVAECASLEFSCDVSPETLQLTRLATAKVGDSVNLERALRLDERLGGHFVLGHVDQTCVLMSKNEQGEYIALTFSGITPEGKMYCVKKGSICVNGVSLTLNAVIESGFEVMLIPETLNRTNLSQLQVGDKVNIEYDYLAKLVCNAPGNIAHQCDQ